LRASQAPKETTKMPASAGPTKADLETMLDQVSDLAANALDPTTTRKEAIEALQAIYEIAGPEDDSDDSDDSDDTDDDDEE
jgi:hypothetical protein